MNEEAQNIGPKEVEIVASYSGKISTGRFENEAPFFSIKETWSNIDDNFIQHRQKELHNYCYNRFSECEKRSMVDRIQEEYKHLRFYEYNNEQFPSSTSIINWDKDFYIPQEQLIQYAARGIIRHKQIEIFHKTGEWHTPEAIDEVYPQLVILKKGSLGLTLDGYDYQAFYEKYPFEVVDVERAVYNPEYRYAGRYDIKGVFDGKVSIIDVKTTSTIDKDSCFKQLASYAKCLGNEDVEQLVVIPLNNKTQQGFSKPVIEDGIDKYFALFKKDRQIFKERFGL